MKRILLVQLYGKLQPANVAPFAVEVLAGALKRYCQSVEVEIVTVHQSVGRAGVSHLLETILAWRPDIVGLSIPQGTLKVANWILEEVPDSLPTEYKEPLLLLGHAIPTNAPEILLSRFPRAIAVQGWGEDALVSLVNQFPNIRKTEIPGIFYYEKGELRGNEVVWKLRPEKPTYHNLSQYFARVEASRGCTYNSCTYCLRPTQSNSSRGTCASWQRVPVDQVLDSIQDLKNRGIVEFTFSDEDLFGSDPGRVIELAQGLVRIGGMRFTFSALADDFFCAQDTQEEKRFRRHAWRLLKEAGVSLVYCGVESLSQSQLRRYGKRARLSETVKGMKEARMLEIETELGLILFDPLLTMQELRENVKALEDTGLWRNAKSIFGFLNIYRNTPFEKWAKRLNMLGKFDPDLLLYEWKFVHEDVGLLAEHCHRFRERFHLAYSALRHVQRTSLNTPYAQQYLARFRRQDLSYLAALTQADERQYRTITQLAEEARRDLLVDLRAHIEPIVNCDAEFALLDNLREIS